MHPLIPYFEPFKIPISGAFAIHGFGILVAIGFILGSKVAMWKAKRDGLEPEFINRLVGWLVVGVFIGGHLGHLLFYYPEQLIEDPMVLFDMTSGLSSFGGFLACAALGVWFFRKEDRKIRDHNRKARETGEPRQKRLHIRGYIDAVLFGLTVGWGFGRVGCFAAHDHSGMPTDFWLGVYGMCPDEPITVACHDLGLYEAIWSFAMFGLFMLLDRKPRFPGFYTGMMLAIYGPVRLFLDVFRHPATDTRYFGLTPAQYGSVAFALIGFYMLAKFRHETPVSLRDASDDEAPAPPEADAASAKA